MPEVKAVCFDLFHTLVDVGRVPNALGTHTADLLGLDREAWNEVIFSDLHEIRKPTTHLEVLGVLARSVKPDISDELLHHAAEQRQRRFDHTLKNVDKETLSCLAEIRSAGLGIALISNASTAETASWKDSPLAEYFDAAVFSWECGYAKPEAGIYLHAAKQLGVNPEHCVFVGDGGSNEHPGANAVGMHSVMIKRYINEDKANARRAHVRHEINEIDELPGLLKALGAA